MAAAVARKKGGEERREQPSIHNAFNFNANMRKRDITKKREKNITFYIN